MKRAIMVAIIIGLITTCAWSAEPGGWSWGLFLGELGVSAGFSYGLGYVGTALARNDNGEAIASIVGVTVGSTAGVLLIGELVDEPSDNKLIAYTLTTASAAAFPIFYVFAVPNEGELFTSNDVDPEFPPRLWFGTLLPPIAPGAATLTYNVVKRTKAEKPTAKSNLPIDVYSTLLADNGAGPVPVYGVSVSI